MPAAPRDARRISPGFHGEEEVLPMRGGVAGRCRVVIGSSDTGFWPIISARSSGELCSDTCVDAEGEEEEVEKLVLEGVVAGVSGIAVKHDLSVRNC